MLEVMKELFEGLQEASIVKIRRENISSQQEP